MTRWILFLLPLAAPCLHPAYAQRQGETAAEGEPATATICVFRTEDRDAFFTLASETPPGTPDKTAAATFTTTFVDEDANDPWPAAAKTAFLFATDLWAERVTSRVPIRIEATWKDLGSCTGSSFTLGTAGPRLVWRNFSNAPRADTWYPDALADALRGSDLGNDDFDITAQFNRSCGPSAFDRWYLGTDAAPPPGRVDFVTVVLHELGHGLGFTGTANVDDGSAANGAECNGTAGNGCLGLGADAAPEIYDRFTEDGTGTRLFDLTSPSATLGRALAGESGGVFFDGPVSVQANGGELPRLFAPDPFDAGASYVHLDEATFDLTPNALMTPTIARAEAVHQPGDVACGILADLGWVLTPMCGSLVTSAQEPGAGAAGFELSAAYPNPFNAQTRLTLTLASEQRVTVAVFDLLGRRVAQLYDGVPAADVPHLFTFEAGNLPAGLYLIRVTGETFHAVRPASLLR